MTEILPLKKEDCAAAAKLEAECLREAWSERSIAALCDSADAAVLAAYETGDGAAGSPVGLAHCGFVLDEAHLNNVSVAPGYRRRGIAEALMRKLFDTAKARGCSVMFLDVRGSNTAAVSLYEKLGFARLGERAGAYPVFDGEKIVGRENALVMGKKLL